MDKIIQNINHRVHISCDVVYIELGFLILTGGNAFRIVLIPEPGNNLIWGQIAGLQYFVLPVQ